MSRHPVTAALVLCGVFAGAPAEAAQRVFVASYGNDANTATGCAFANPCRGFTAAMTAVDSGGEVVALDAAGYGAVTITKSVTITANPGFYAGISAATGIAVTIATAGVNVTLRGLNINGIGAPNGVRMTNGARLSIENCVVSNFSNNGVFVGTNAVVRISDSLIRDNFEGVFLENGPRATISGTKLVGNSDVGILLLGTTAGVTTSAAVADTVVSGSSLAVFTTTGDGAAVVRASITRSTLANNDYGPVTGGGPGTELISIGYSMVTGNGVAGLYQSGAATLESLGNNIVRQNGADIGTITTVPLR
jgi:hypothetical protein